MNGIILRNNFDAQNVTDSLSMGQYSLLQTDPVIQTHDVRAFY